MMRRRVLSQIRLLGSVCITATFMFGLPIAGLAASPAPSPASSKSTNSTVTQGFKVSGATTDYVNGALVANSQITGTVELADTDNADQLIGVISIDPLVSLSIKSDQVQVAMSGTTPALVSDINGKVRAGDKIAPSPIKGVGMRATANTQVVGTAVNGLDVAASQTQTVIGRNGKSHTIHIATIHILANVTSFQAAGSGLVPPVIQDAVNRLAGRQVAFARVIFAGLLCLAGFAAAAILLSTAVKSGIVSIGRNPLASSAIRRGMFQVAGIIFAVIAFTLGASYIILVV